MMPGRALKVCGGGGGVESEFSDRFGYSLALAKPNNIQGIGIYIHTLTNWPICVVGHILDKVTFGTKAKEMNKWHIANGI